MSAPSTSFVPVVLRENLSWDEMARIEVNTLELPGVVDRAGADPLLSLRRRRSRMSWAMSPRCRRRISHGDDPLLELPDFRIGKNGIEKAYDLELRGTAGTSQVEVNAFGRVVRELAREEGMPGQDIVAQPSTWRCRTSRSKRCAGEGSASCVVLDAWTGEVLALASTPGYDPGAFAAGLTPTMWQELIADPLNPLSNKAISGAYAPGSTFKLMVAMAALEAGVHHRRTRAFFCPGHFTLGNALFHCWKKGGHGTLVAAATRIKQSCDVFFYRHGAIRSASTSIAAMANRFGLGVKLGIDIPGEKTGLIPTRAWKMATTGVAWQRGETISCGIGQSFVSVTPLQLATYSGAARHRPRRRAAPHARAGRDDRGKRAADRHRHRFRLARRRSRHISSWCATACSRW